MADDIGASLANALSSDGSDSALNDALNLLKTGVAEYDKIAAARRATNAATRASFQGTPPLTPAATGAVVWFKNPLYLGGGVAAVLIVFLLLKK